jgi:hypothetical protein
MVRRTQTKARTPEELVKDGFAALVEKLGLADAVRFVQTKHPGEGDYTRDRHKWLDQLSEAEIARLVAERGKPRRRRRQ